MSDLGTSMDNRGMFNQTVRTEHSPRSAQSSGGIVRDCGETTVIVKINASGEIDVFKPVVARYLDCCHLLPPDSKDAIFCDCGKYVCQLCIGLCAECLKKTVCRLCLAVFREKKDNKEQILFLCAECHRKKKRKKLIKTILSIVVFPFKLIVEFVIQKGEYR